LVGAITLRQTHLTNQTYPTHPTMNLLERVRQFARRHGLFRPETRVVVALSGGSDSVALAYIASELAAVGELRLVGTAHFNHHLRDTAIRDERHSADVAASLAVPILIDGADVAAKAAQERRSVEGAARAARYEFFERARRHFEADVVALGHTRDDQAETFLLRLIRGAGARGLAAIHPRHRTIVRPVLDCRRHELRAYLAECGAGYVEDETNADVSIPRNRVRAELLPLLEQRFNPAIVDVLADEAELARESWQWMDTAADELWRRAEKGVRPLVELDVATLMAAPLAVRRFVLWRAMNEVAGKRPVSFRHVEAVLGLLGSGSPSSIDAPGQRVKRDGERLVLTGRPAHIRGRWNPENPVNPANVVNLANRVNLFQYPLSIPGELALAEAGCVVSVESASRSQDAQDCAPSGNGPVALVRRDLCREPLAVRNRRPGDRFRPVGLGGRKKLQDYFVDRKVASARRDQVPIVVDESDRIVWVAGYGIDEAFQVTDASQAVLILRIKGLGGTV
jgi:tRNA(Ile)-lysidine synthase